MPLQKPSEEIKWARQKFPLIVVVENIHSPSNIGLIIRTCECFGVETIYFVGEYSNVNSDKFRRITRASEKYIDIIVRENSTELLHALQLKDYKLIALEISERSSSLSNFQLPLNAKTALIVGSERHGISEETLQIADNLVHIEQYGRTGSLNVSMALSVALYEITKQIK